MFSYLIKRFKNRTATEHQKTDSQPIEEPPIDLEKKKRLLPESRFVIEVTDKGIVNHRPEGKIESVLFEDLLGVVIETNDTGPWGTDLWWILVGREGKGGCLYPGGATGEVEALNALQKLPGFDNEAFIRAMGSVYNAKFVCWKSPELEAHLKGQPKA